MAMSMKFYASVLVLAAGTASFAQLFTDDFNRPDSTDLGPNWDHIAGTATRVIGNEAGNTASSTNLSLVNTGLFSASYDITKVSADIRLTTQATTTAFVALAIGHNGIASSGNGIYIKLQRQSTTQGWTGFTHVGFYTGNGINNTTAITGGSNFFQLTGTFDAARMVIWASNPTTINLGIDTDFNGSYEQEYSRTLNIGPLTVGSRVGIGVFGTTARADNFRAEAVPEPATISALALGGLALLRRRSRKA